MPVFNNLVVFDQTKLEASFDTIVPDLGLSWAWDAPKTRLTFKLAEGVKWHDGKPFTAKDVKCTFDLVAGLVDSEDFRKNPRRVWYHNVAAITTSGDHEVSFQLKEPQPSFLALLASGYSPIYPCHVSQRDMRAKPVGTGPFKVVEFKRSVSVSLARNPDYWKKGLPLLDSIEYRVIDNRSTRVLAFIAGDIDLTFVSDITVAGLKDIAAQAPNAKCQFVPSNNTINMIVNAGAPPFDKPEIRKAMALALDRPAFNTILAEGKSMIGAVMLPSPDGKWGMPDSELAKIPGYDPNLANNQAEALKIMQSLGYSAANPLKVKVSTRNIPLYRDPAVIFIDQMKKIHIDGELEVVDSTIWHAKVQRKDYAIGLNTTGVGVDDPGREPGRELHLQVRPQLHRLLQRGGGQADLRAVPRDRSAEAPADPVGGGAQDRRRRRPPDHSAQPRGHLLAVARQGRHQPQQLALQQLAHGECLARQVSVLAAASSSGHAGRDRVRRRLSRHPAITGGRSK
jgi:peptide/nickel transport system substrate-binding protein